MLNPDLLPLPGWRLTQIFVPGRGLEPASAEFPGTIQPDSPYSRDSFERAEATRQFLDHYKAVHTVLFSGDHSYVMPPTEQPEHGTEAEAMAAHLLKAPQAAGRWVIIDNEADDTISNWLGAARLLDPHKTIGVVAHRDHMKRVMRSGRLVLSKTPLIPLPVEAVFGPHSTANRRQSVNDRVANVIYGAGMIGVKRDDLEAIEERRQRIKRGVLGGLASQRAVADAIGMAQITKNYFFPQNID